MEENKELNEEVNETFEESEELSGYDADDVSGGRGGEIYYAGRYAGDRTRPWEVIDAETGDVVKRCMTKGGAISYAKRHGRSTDEIYWDEVAERRRMAARKRSYEATPKKPFVSPLKRFSDWLNEDISGDYDKQ